MPRKYENKEKLCQWRSEDMAAAIQEVRDNKTPLSTAAKRFSVPRNTLRSRVLNGNVSNRQTGKGATLNAAVEDELVRHLLLLDAKGFGLTVTDVRELAFKYAQRNNITHKFNCSKQMAGYDWVYSFLERHPNLSVRKAQGLSYARSRGLNKEEVGKFFTNLRTMYDTLDLWEDPGRIFNADETGLQLIFKPGKVISPKGKKDVYHATTGEKGSTVTVMVCSSATGNPIPPFVIMKGVRQKPSYSKGLPNGSSIQMSESGYMISELFSSFLDHLNKYKPHGKILLILDGHASHCKDPNVLDKASNLGIEMLCLPPHSTHKCQPLDVSYFKSLKHFYNEACRNFVRHHPGRHITKEDFGDIFRQAWDKSTTTGNLTSGFRKCGIYPYNPDVLADDVYEYELVTAQKDAQVRVGDDITEVNDSVHLLSTRSSFEAISPVPVVESKLSGRKATRKQESVVLTSKNYRRQLREKTSTQPSKRRSVKNVACSSAHITDKDNYCGECGGFYYDDSAGQKWVKCVGQCNKWFHEMCVENGDELHFKCDNCS